MRLLRFQRWSQTWKFGAKQSWIRLKNSVSRCQTHHIISLEVYFISVKAKEAENTEHVLEEKKVIPLGLFIFVSAQCCFSYLFVIWLICFALPWPIHVNYNSFSITFLRSCTFMISLIFCSKLKPMIMAKARRQNKNLKKTTKK